MVEIDGSVGEGGGQIIRTALSLAAITGRPVAFRRVRAGRAKPGLKAQHLTAVMAAAALCSAEVLGATAGSTDFTFTPRHPIDPRRYHHAIGTAGATTLVLQTVLVPLAFAGGGHLTVVGGTHVPFAPTADYFDAVYLPALAAAGIAATLGYERAGFFPQGGGELTVSLTSGPTPSGTFLPRLALERGKLVSLAAIVVTSGLPPAVALRAIATLEAGLTRLGLDPVEKVIRDVPARNSGAAVLIAGQCAGGPFGFSALGERGKPIERVAQDALGACAAWWASGATTEEHLADQLVLPLALAAGESRWSTYPVTEHLRTVLEVARQFLPIVAHLEERSDGTGLVTLVGAPPANRGFKV